MFSLLIMSLLAPASADILSTDGSESCDGPIICTPDDADGNGIPDVDEEDSSSDDEGGIFDWLEGLFDWLGGDDETAPDTDPGDGSTGTDEPGTSPDTGTCPGDVDIPECDGEGGVCEMPLSMGGMHSLSETLMVNVHTMLAEMQVGDSTSWHPQSDNTAIRFVVTNRHVTQDRIYTVLSVRHASAEGGSVTVDTREVWILEEADQIFFLTELDPR